ncbi:hypothetical protein [Methylobacterium tardum]|uniref:Uncharacterized protein n=1 Tax=Methylobacterium tardum TaxID=374432 RepID=A0AA37TQ27_9HYPH|nr:hypothetical protein [Methylobacterium tardum]URD40244.1 hypothetical protein M6G65_22075 [Methylobacterium tardum]GLS73517.1 hypothetical protein GCM10007890_55320 [Methylobacterium tardum]
MEFAGLEADVPWVFVTLLAVLLELVVVAVTGGVLLGTLEMPAGLTAPAAACGTIPAVFAGSVATPLELLAGLTVEGAGEFDGLAVTVGADAT